MDLQLIAKMLIMLNDKHDCMLKRQQEIFHEVQRIMVDLSKLTAEVNTLQTNVANLLQQNAAHDASVQQQVDAVTAQVTSINNSIVPPPAPPPA